MLLLTAKDLPGSFTFALLLVPWSGNYETPRHNPGFLTPRHPTQMSKARHAFTLISVWTSYTGI